MFDTAIIPGVLNFLDTECSGLATYPSTVLNKISGEWDEERMVREG